jgi:hypothetical protein
MAKEAPVLEGLRVASPCEVPWVTMKGDDRVRHCGACRLNVYNLSAMSRGEAEALVRNAEGRLCVRFFRRADGTVLTQDCPVGLEKVRRRLRRIGNAVAAAFTAFLFAGCARSAPPEDGPPKHSFGYLVPVDQPTMGKPAIPEQGAMLTPTPLQGEVAAPPPKDPK